jgi:hypothetical protein
MAKKTSNADVWVFCGDGMGIAGLPHRVTAKQAQELGLLSELEAGIQSGVYKPEKQNADNMPTLAESEQ